MGDNSRNIYAANIYMELHWYIPRVHETLLYSYSKFTVISWYTGICKVCMSINWHGK